MLDRHTNTVLCWLEITGIACVALVVHGMSVYVRCYCWCVQVHCVVWLLCVVGEGSGRHGYEVRCAGGGIGAGFPSVSFRGPVTPNSYLLLLQR